MKKLCYLLFAIVLAFFITSSLDLKGAAPKPEIQETSTDNPFGKVDGTAGKDTAIEEKKIEVIPSISSRGGSDIVPEKEVNINLKVYIVEKKQIKEMNLEEYIEGVVAGEMPIDFDMEALKAQAIAARTYTVARMKAFSGSGCSKYTSADICTDSAHCQAWVSKADTKIKDAVNATKGLILAYDSAPVMYPLFFSTSSGRTENSQDVFVGEYPYLKSVLSPYEEIAPKYLSKTTLSKDAFIKKFNGYGCKLDKKSLLSQVKILARTDGGSVKSAKIGAKNFPGNEIRSILSLNSANFNIDFNNDSVIITVTGFGHGVGMSQWGANEMGKRGNKYYEILKHYYLGTEIVRIKDVFR